MKNLVWIFCLAFLSSCDDPSYIYELNEPKIQTFGQTFKVKELLETNKIDILWVIDNSGSMDSIQQNVKNNASLFMENFIHHKHLNWKMGLLSTDLGQLPYLGFQTLFDYTHVDPVSAFQAAVGRLGIGGSNIEITFEKIEQELKSYPDFHRPDAHLAIIMVSDEPEQSADPNGKYHPNTFVNRVDATVQQFAKLRFYGAFNFRDLKGCERGNSWDDYKGSRFEEVIQATNGFAIGACAEDFGQKLAEIGKDIGDLVESPKVLLDQRPLVETIEIKYEGQILPGGRQEDGGHWYYDDLYNTINFYNLNFAPDFNTNSIEVSFQINDGVQR